MAKISYANFPFCAGTYRLLRCGACGFASVADPPDPVRRGAGTGSGEEQPTRSRRTARPPVIACFIAMNPPPLQRTRHDGAWADGFD